MISSVNAVNPFGPVQEYVKGPVLPPVVISMAPLKGNAHRLLSVITLPSVRAGVISLTVIVAVAKHPLGVSVTVTS